MVYQYDQALQLPTVDLYDTLMMAMALQAAKDMYDRGEQLIKDFQKNFGDFLTPITADQNWWNQNVTGRVRDAINQIYARGGDPLRNAQDRAQISMLINNMPYGDMAKLRTSAKNAEEYIKNRAKLIADGDYNSDFERFRLGGRSIDNWSTVDNDAAWNEVSPSKFKDINKWSSHLFDNMELSYDPEETKKHPGFLAYTKSRDTMNKIVDDNIAALVDTDQGKYFLQQAYDSIPSDFLGNRKEEALRRLKERVVNSNWEENQIKLESDPYAVARYSASLIGNRGGGSSRLPKNSLAYDSAEGLFYRGLIKSGGTEYYHDLELAVEDGRDNIVQRQIALLKQTQQRRLGIAAALNYILDELSIEEAPGNFSRYTQIPLTSGVMPIDEHWAKRMYSDESIVSHMYGITYGKHDGESGKTKKQYKKYTDRTGLVGKMAIPTTKVRTTFTQRANGEYAIRQFWQMEIGTMDENGFVGEGKYMEFELPTSRSATHFMPYYPKYKEMHDADKAVIIRPSIKEDPATMGWKNTGSMQVNLYEHTPAPMGFWGTSNNEAFEER